MTESPKAPGSMLTDLEAHALASPAGEAFRFLPEVGDPAAGQVWSWGELRERARAVARDLARSPRCRPGARVLLAYPAGLGFIAAFYGCIYAGAVPVPLALPRRRERAGRWRAIARDCAASAILCDPAWLAIANGALEPGHALVSAAADPDAPVPEGGPCHPAPEFAPSDPAFLQYTSGSTGHPKGIVVTHGMLRANLAQIGAAFGYVPGDRTLGWLPHYHDMGLLSSILSPVHLGVPHALMSPASFLRDPIRFLELVAPLGATVIGGPNFGYEHCLRRATPEAVRRIDLSGLRMAFTGAENVRADTLRAFHRAFGPCGFDWSAWAGSYGLAEATVCVCVGSPGSGPHLVSANAQALSRHEVMAGDDLELADSGVPAPGIELAIVDPATGHRGGGNRVGEIWVRGPNVANAYWNRPEESAAVFDQWLDGSGGWLRTGDLGFLRDGRLFVTGRLKEMIVVRGQNHYPQDIETTVAGAHPHLLADRVAAFALGARDGEVGVACEVSRPACRDLDPEPVFAAIRAALTEGHGIAVHHIRLLRPGALPVTSSGKIRRGACKGDLDALAQWRASGPEPVCAASRGALAEELRATRPALRRGRLIGHLAEAFAQATGLPGAAAERARFFDAGLDSVAGVALVGDLAHVLDMPLDATLIYEFPTPAALADHLLDRLSRHAPGVDEAGEDAPSSGPDIRALEALLAADP